MAFWACAQTAPRRESVARHFLQLSDFEVYLPLVCERRKVQTRRVETVRPLFPNYLFVRIELQWSRARWAIGVTRLILDGERPAVVSDRVVDAIRARERNGLVELPSRLQRGDRVRVLRGPFREQLGLYDGQAAHERVGVLLSLFGGQQRMTLPKGDVEAVC